MSTLSNQVFSSPGNRYNSDNDIYSLTVSGPWATTTTPTRIIRDGFQVALQLPNLSFASTIASPLITLTGLPNFYLPTQQNLMPVVLIDNNTQAIGIFEILGNGTMTVKKVGGGNFTGTCGIVSQQVDWLRTP